MIVNPMNRSIEVILFALDIGDGLLRPIENERDEWKM